MSTEHRGTVFSKETSDDFGEWLERHSNRDTADLTVIALVDPGLLQLTDAQVKTFSLDFRKIRKAKRSGFEVPDSPFESLKSSYGEAPFNFGWQSFRFRTREATGRTSIAVSIWADGKPVDELTLSLCIGASTAATECTGKLSASNRFAGADLTMRGIYPDLAIHLVDRRDGVVGVLRCNTCNWRDDEYRNWDVQETADWVSEQVNEITATIGGWGERATPAEVDQVIADAGDGLYNVIFHARNQDNDATRAFADFMEKGQAAQRAGSTPPTLFVRIIPERPSLMMAPIGMMRGRSRSIPPEFVGFVANVQTPLEYQDYSPSQDCISRWVLFVPPEVPPQNVNPREMEMVIAARRQFQKWIAEFKERCAGCRIIDNVDDFKEWLQSSAVESQVVLILSHHSHNALFFNQTRQSPKVLANIISRRFASPSVVILDACGTAEPGASEFIRQFNYGGISSAIATSAKVDPDLAGKFLDRFLTLLREHENDANYTVSQARFDTVKDLKSEFGPRALAFTLAGNGAVRLCVPRRP